MLGTLLDKVFVTCSDRNGELPPQVENHTFRKKDKNTNWVCFVPEFCYRTPFIRKRIFPKGINMDIYVLPKTAVQPNPELTCEYLDNILKTAIQNQNRYYSGKEVNLLGISMGNVLAFRFAEQFQVNKLYSVVPGSRLAECIWESIATKKIAQNSGRDIQYYKRSLSGYNPIESVSKLNLKISEIYLGMCDLMIPYERGRELAVEMKGKFKTNLHVSQYSGHVETIVSFSKQFQGIARAIPRP